MINFLIADDHPLIVKSVADLIHEAFPKSKIQTANNWKEVRHRIHKCVDIYILDLEMPNGRAVEEIESIKKECPESKCILLTNHTQSWILQELVEFKIDAFVSKISDPKYIIDAINFVSKKDVYMCPEFKRVYSNSGINFVGEQQLTKREKEVLFLILKAKSTKEIAELLSVSVNTVETHRKNLFLKFDVKNVVGLVNKAAAYGKAERLI